MTSTADEQLSTQAHVDPATGASRDVRGHCNDGIAGDLAGPDDFDIGVCRFAYPPAADSCFGESGSAAN